MQYRLLAAASMAAVVGMLGNAAGAAEQGCPNLEMGAATRLGIPVLHGHLEIGGNTVEVRHAGAVRSVELAALSAIEWDCNPNAADQSGNPEDFVFLTMNDRSQKRLYYGFRLNIRSDGIGEKPHFLWASRFPNVLQNAGLEGLRLDPKTKRMYLSTEEPSAVHAFDRRPDGLQRASLEFVVPGPHPTPGSNSGLEGLALLPGGARLFAAMEHPVGTDSGAVRILAFNATGGTPQEYRYCVDSPTPGRKQAGVSEILAVNATTLLVLERGYTAAKPRGERVEARLFTTTLQSGATCLPKKPYFDLVKLRRSEKLPQGLDWIDNFEGMTFGPDLCNGDGTLLLISDNNGSDKQKTQLVVLRLQRGSSSKSCG